jgi:hypothetical protein
MRNYEVAGPNCLVETSKKGLEYCSVSIEDNA